MRGVSRAPESANSVAMMASSSQRSCSMTTGWPTHSVKVRVLRPASGWSGRISAPTAVGNSAITSTPRCRLSTNSTPKSLSPERSASPISLGCTASTVKLTLGWRADISSTTCGRKRTSSRFQRDDADVAAHRAAQARDLRPRALVFVLRLAHVAQQQLAGRRRAHAAPAALEQRHAHLVLEPQDLPVDRRGGDAQRIGGLADRAVARDMVEIAQDRGVHGDLPFPGGRCRNGSTPRELMFFSRAPRVNSVSSGNDEGEVAMRQLGSSRSAAAHCSRPAPPPPASPPRASCRRAASPRPRPRPSTCSSAGLPAATRSARSRQAARLLRAGRHRTSRSSPAVPTSTASPSSPRAATRSARCRPARR